MAWPRTVCKSDLRIDFYRGSGAGGQKRNKTSSACRITHVETGLSAQCEDGRSQTDNRRIAFTRLAAKLVPLMRAAANEFYRPLPSVETVRTYNEKMQRVKNHRTGETARYSDVLDGRVLP